MQFIFGLRWRLLALTFLIAIPAFVLMYLDYLEQREYAAHEAQEDALTLVRGVANAQNQFVGETQLLLTTLASIPQLHPARSNNCNILLDGLEENLPYDFIGVVSPTGDIVCGTPPLEDKVNVADRTYFQRVMSSRAFAAGDFVLSRVTGYPVLVFAAPILNPDQPEDDIQGMVIAVIELAWLEQEIASDSLPTGAAITIFDQFGTVLARYPDRIPG